MTPIRSEEDVSQPLVLVLNNNLFFRFPIEDALAKQGCRGVFAQTVARFHEGLESERPDLAIVDLEVRPSPSGQAVDWQGCIRAAAEGGVPVITFGAHDDLETRAAALAAGAGAFYSKAKFHADLPALIERHVVRVAP
jgi:DNA-binding response OmpR family regulator